MLLNSQATIKKGKMITSHFLFKEFIWELPSLMILLMITYECRTKIISQVTATAVRNIEEG